MKQKYTKQDPDTYVIQGQWSLNHGVKQDKKKLFKDGIRVDSVTQKLYTYF